MVCASGEITTFDQAIDAINMGVSMGVVMLTMNDDVYDSCTHFCENAYTVGLLGFTEECVREEDLDPCAGRRSFLAMLRAARPPLHN